MIHKDILNVKRLLVLWLDSCSFLVSKLFKRRWTFFSEEGFNSIEKKVTNLNQSWNLPKLRQVPWRNWVSYCHKEVTPVSTLVLSSFSLLLSLFLAMYSSPLMLTVTDIWKHDKLDPGYHPDERKLRQINRFVCIWLHRP